MALSVPWSALRAPPSPIAAFHLPRSWNVGADMTNLVRLDAVPLLLMRHASSRNTKSWPFRDDFGFDTSNDPGWRCEGAVLSFFLTPFSFI
jgi:hypothetical protein